MAAGRARAVARIHSPEKRAYCSVRPPLLALFCSLSCHQQVSSTVRYTRARASRSLVCGDRSMTTAEHDQREHDRVKIKVPIEIYAAGSDSRLRGATSDLGLGGCYTETIFPLPIGGNLELKLQLEDRLALAGTVVTSDRQVGNGIRFSRMLPEDVGQLRAFLEEAEKKQS